MADEKKNSAEKTDSADGAEKKDEAVKKEEKIVDKSADSKEVKEVETKDSSVDSASSPQASSEKQAEFPELKPGMTVKVYQKIKELNLKGEEKERIQFFEGMIIAKKHGKESGGTITVRKVSNGVGVEKIFPLNLPTLEKIEVKKIAAVRRAKLFFLKRDYKKRLKETVVSK